jgi:hypothetical protein
VKQSREDLFNAMLVDLVADQVRRALELGWTPEEVEAGVLRGMGHGLAEFQQDESIRKRGSKK